MISGFFEKFLLFSITSQSKNRANHANGEIAECLPVGRQG